MEHNRAVPDSQNARTPASQLAPRESAEEAWIEIKEGCEMPPPDEQVLIYSTSSLGIEHAYMEMSEVYFDSPRDALDNYVTHWRRIVAPQESKSDAPKGEA